MAEGYHPRGRAVATREKVVSDGGDMRRHGRGFMRWMVQHGLTFPKGLRVGTPRLHIDEWSFEAVQ